MKAKKSLGQNFLKDVSVVDHILEVAQLETTDWVVEIGPGTGALTEKLAQKVERVIAIELDQDLIPGLLHKFPASSNVSIIEGDILTIHLTALLQEKGLGEKSYKVVANIPYYVTAPIIQSLLRLLPQSQSITLMILC
jgi:16S rRNA (adenine1518-N6/adenine1519-N6)-dimethyltransferase